jgi:hypothetical protein
MVEALIPNFFCRFKAPRELHSDLDSNIGSCLIHEVLQRLGLSKTCITFTHPQSDGMVMSYIKTVEEYL